MKTTNIDHNNDITRKNLAQCTETQISHATKTSILLNNVGVDHFQEQQLQKAEISFYNALYSSKLTDASLSHNFCEGRYHLGTKSPKRVRNDLGDDAENEGMESYPIVLKINETQTHDENYYIAVMLYNLAVVFKHTNRMEQSYVCYHRALDFANNNICDESDNSLKMIVVSILHGMGLLEYRTGDYCSAMISYTKAYHYCREKISSNKLQLASSLHCMGMVQYDDVNGNNEESLACFNKALCIRRLELGNIHAEVAHGYNNIGNVHLKLKHYKEAGIAYMEARRIRVALLGGNHIDVAKVTFNIGQTFNLLGKVEHALALCSDVFRVVKDQCGEYNPKTLAVIKYIADLLYGNNQIDEALRTLKHILQIERAIYGNCHPQIADTMDKIGNIYFNKKEYDTAVETLQLSILIREKQCGSKHPSNIISIIILADIQAQKGKFEEARKMYTDALSHVKMTNTAQLKHIASILRHMAYKLYQNGERKQSLLVYFDLFAILSNLKEAYKDFFEDSFIISDIGTVLMKNESFLDLALQAHQLSLQIQNAVQSADHQNDLVTTLYNIAMIYEQQDDFENALEYYKQTMCLEINLLGKNHQDIATTLNSIGEIQYRVGDLDEALTSFERAVQIELDCLDPDYIGMSKAIWNIGNIYLEKGDLSKAIETFSKLLRIYESFGMDPYEIFPCDSTLYILGLKYPKPAPAA